jgi:hypothetical protein
MRFLAIVLFLLPGLAWAGCVVRTSATVPLQVLDGMLLVPAMVNDIEGTFILDTGAARSVVTREATRHLQLARDPWVATTMQGVGGVERLPNANPRSLTMGGAKLERHTISHDTSFTVGTLPRSQAGGLTVDGLLGRDFLSVFDLVVDMPNRRVTLMSVTGCAGRFLPWAEPYDAIAAENPMESALVLPVELDGVRLRTLLDTGAGATLVAARGMFRLGLTAANLRNDPGQAVNGLGPNTVVMQRHVFRALRVGTQTSAHPSFWVAPVRLVPIVDMLLGADWLAGRRVWISFATKQVFVAGM